MVELDQIKKFNQIQKKTMDCEPTSIFKIIDDENISIRDFNEDEIITLERSEFSVNGKTIKAFDVSLGWTWSEEEINK
jgi:predicted Zn-dependent protease with MMP-like domain